nr:hypothetical protein [Tanacetum cinerariifolium]
QAGAATRLAQLKASFGQNLVNAFGNCLLLNLLGARYDDGFHVPGFVLALHVGGHGAQVLDARVGAAADENIVDLLT